MKTILVATDYSREANNALQYASKLAEFSKARLVLFHAYNIPAPVTDVPGVLPPATEEINKENIEAIEKLSRKTIKQAGGKLKVEGVAGLGMPVEEILNAIEKTKADLVIMGIRGASRIAETLIGSTATSVMQKTKVPVLVIPAKSKFREAHKIVLAYDYKKPLAGSVFKIIRDFARLFKAEVEVVHVVKLEEEPDSAEAKKLVKLKAALKGIKHNFYFPVSENITDELNLFVKKNKAGMLVMFPHKHNILQKLYHPSDTKRMAFHTNVPLLSLHD